MRLLCLAGTFLLLPAAFATTSRAQTPIEPVRLNIRSNIPSPGAAETAERYLRQLLRWANLESTDDSAAVSITIEIDADALAGSYEGARIYTGAAAKGSIVLERDGSQPVLRKYAVSLGPAPAITVLKGTPLRGSGPESAPFVDALRAPGGLFYTFFDLLADSYGPRFLNGAWDAEQSALGSLFATTEHHRGREQAFGRLRTALLEFLIVKAGDSRAGEREAAVRFLGGALSGPTKASVSDVTGDVTKRAQEVLLRASSDSDAKVRLVAIGAIAKLAHPDAPRVLSAALQDESVTVRAWAAELMKGRTDPTSVAQLIRVLRDRPAEPRRSFEDLRKQNLTQYNDVLAAQRTRSRAAEALAQSCDTTAVPALIDAVTLDAFAVADDAARALGALGDARAIPALIGALQFEDSLGWAPAAAAYALVNLADLRTIQQSLLDVLRAPYSTRFPAEYARLAAAGALASAGDPQGIDYLLNAGWAAGINMDAIRAVTRITGQNFDQDAMKWRKWWQKERDRFKPVRPARAACIARKT